MYKIKKEEYLKGAIGSRNTSRLNCEDKINEYKNKYKFILEAIQSQVNVESSCGNFNCGLRIKCHPMQVRDLRFILNYYGYRYNFTVDTKDVKSIPSMEYHLEIEW